MKSLYLYISNDTKDVCKMQDVFCFKNNKIVAVDKYRYNKEERRSFQQKYNIYPYPVSQDVLKEMLHYIRENNSEFLIRDIQFIDNSIEDESEYQHLLNLILANNTSEVYNFVFHIMDAFDTDIFKLTFRYKGYEFSITTEGVLTIEAPDEILASFIMNNKANRLILGLS